MHFDELRQELADPACYPSGSAAVAIVQTHISLVCLVGDRVYKLKKPVRLPFLDFTSLARRRWFCREEVRLNRRLCADVYLGTCALRRGRDGLRFAACGDDDGSDDLDVAVVMRRLPAERMLDRLLADGNVDDESIRGLATHLAAFHRTADRTAAVLEAGDPDRLLASARANFTELAAVCDHGLDVRLLTALAQASGRRLQVLRPELRVRAAAGCVVDGHGDLHARNVCMTAPPAIYDCIEFEPAFRCGDVANEVAFLVMDLRYRGAGALADAFVAAYVQATGDRGLPALLPAFVGYRAMVRAKVAAFAAADAGLPAADRAGAHGSAVAHLQLAAAAAIERGGLQWLLLCGPPGSGKSTLARQLQRGTHWPCVATDQVRKELAGLSPTARAAAAHYTAGFTVRTYGEVLTRASALTVAGARVVLVDGNFAQPDQRAAAIDAARAAGACLRIVHVDIDAAIGRQRVTERLADPAHISDAGPAEYEALCRRFIVPEPAATHELHRIDGAMPVATQAAQLLAALVVAVG